MREGVPISNVKTLILDSSFEFEVKKDNNHLWKVKDDLLIDVEISSQYEGILEYCISSIMVDGYIDLREENPETLESALKSQLGFNVSIYALKQDDKLTPRALELKRRLLDVFERK
jgi:hypothetical protein